MATKLAFTASAFQGCLARRKSGWMQLDVKKAKLSDPNAKKANLSARKKERLKIPSCSDVAGVKREFLLKDFFNHSCGIEAILNAGAVQSYHSLDANLYRCVLPQVQLLNFKVSPVLDLQVAPTDEDCMLELISCKFEGYEAVGQQNEHFSASMRNHITWETVDTQQYLDIDVSLDLVLEIYTLPFTLMPISAVERPGNLMMQVLVDQLVPLLTQQLLQRYEEWIQLQLQCSRSLASIDNELST